MFAQGSPPTVFANKFPLTVLAYSTSPTLPAVVLDLAVFAESTSAAVFAVRFPLTVLAKSWCGAIFTFTLFHAVFAEIQHYQFLLILLLFCLPRTLIDYRGEIPGLATNKSWPACPKERGFLHSGQFRYSLPCSQPAHTPAA